MRAIVKASLKVGSALAKNRSIAYYLGQRDHRGQKHYTPLTASGRICSARDTTAPPIEIPSQKMGLDVLVPMASVTANRSLARLCMDK